MTKKLLRATAPIILLLAITLPIASRVGAVENITAAGIVKKTGVGGGLCVVVGCGNVTLALDLAERKTFLVHGIDRNRASVERARSAALEKGLYGRISFEHWTAEHLPYSDNLVALLVSKDPNSIPNGEAMRVLRPRGALCTRKGAVWETTVKPWPQNMDEWTHWLHGPDGNAASRDTAVDISRSLRWTAEPTWSRHHDFPPSLSAMVSARGRIFYIMDEAPPGITKLPGKWALVARDAFSGILLWRRPIKDWGWQHWTESEVHTFNRQNTPFELVRRLVAADDRLYVTLGFRAPVSEIEAATGTVLQTYQGTKDATEILYHEGKLIVAIGRQKKEIAVLEPATGKTLWRTGGYAGISPRAVSNRIGKSQDSPLFMCAGGPYIFFAQEDDVVCLNLEDGTERWRLPRPERKKQPPMALAKLFASSICTLVHHQGRLFLAQYDHSWRDNMNIPQNMTLVAIDAHNGKVQWRYEGAGHTCSSPPDLFVINGLVWTFMRHRARLTDTKSSTIPVLVGLSPDKGEVRKSIPARALGGGHHPRCWRNKATDRFILTGKDGIEYVDIESGAVTDCEWVRGMCRYGIMPANGLIYAPPHSCGCFADAKLNGFLALAPERKVNVQDPKSEKRFEKGPAFADAAKREPETRTATSGFWPTFRADMRRSGYSESRISSELRKAWETNIGGRLTSITAMGGKVFTASQDTYGVYCLNANTGKVSWRFTAGARIDTPPTCFRNMVLFGSHDGWVHCLRAADGAVAWRFRAAPRDERIVIGGRLESPWPVYGSVLVLDDRAYVVAGRSAHLDSGMYLYCLDVHTGKVLQERRLTPDLESKGELNGAALSDVLLSNGTTIWMRGRQFFSKDITLPPRDKTAVPLKAMSGLLDSAWFNRSFWEYKKTCSAQHLVFDNARAYGIRAYKVRNLHSFNIVFKPGGKGYELFAGGRLPDAWGVNIPVRAQAMVVTEDMLFVAGSPDVVDPKDPWAAFEGRKGALLQAYAKETGKKLSQYKLDAPPVHDGMAVAGGRLHLSTKDGKVLSFGK